MKFKEELKDSLTQWIGEDSGDRIGLGLGYLSALIILNLYYWGIIQL